MRRSTLLRAALRGRALVPGSGAGALLHADVPLSFWGGVDPFSAAVIDHHHPLLGQNLAGKVIAIPSGRGSCTGSLVLLELLLTGRAPAAVLLREPDEVISLGAIVAEELFGCSLPVVALGGSFAQLHGGAWATVTPDGTVRVVAPEAVDKDDSDTASLDAVTSQTSLDTAVAPPLPALSADDAAMLAGAHGPAAQAAMRVVRRAAALQGAAELLDVTQVHIDGCTYIGPSSLTFAQRLVDWGGRVRVPTTLNAVGVDVRRWRELGVDASHGEPSSALAAAYVELGAEPSFTCAPYLLSTAPKRGEHVAWAESNASIFANSCIGARTQKYPDLLDACVALTGRAPRGGCHLDDARMPTLALRAPTAPSGVDSDAFWPALGYLVGAAAGTRVPLVVGLEAATPSCDDLKAFSAAFGTTASAAMFHIAGHTPEAPAEAGEEQALPPLASVWKQLDRGGDSVELVALGSPHLSLEELACLASLCEGRSAVVKTVLTLGRSTLEAAEAAGFAAALRRFGAWLVTDTCWCMLGEPVVPPSAQTLVTNSAKFAHYGPGLLSRGVRFASMAGCVEAAVTGRAPPPPRWLEAGA